MEEASTLDLTDKRVIVQHLRDLLNVGPMLQIDLNEEILKFLRKAEEVGWARELLSDFLERACNFTIYEQYLPHNIPERGDFWKYAQAQKMTKYYSNKENAIFKHKKGAWAG